MSEFVLREKDGVSFYQSGTLNTPHGFSTRVGGVSTAPHLATMNFGFGRGEDRENVEENYRRFLAVTALERPVLAAEQIHSARVFYTDGDRIICHENGEAAAIGKLRHGLFAAEGLQGDAFVTDSEAVALCVKIADCVPILFYDPMGHMVGAAHAGWRGTADGIAARTVETMVAYGAKTENIRAAIGPSIHHECYEVGGDMVDICRERLGAALCDRYFYPLTDGGKLHCDLQGLNKAILTDAGIDPAHIDVCEQCTNCHPDLFFSHRATKGVRGTMVAMIGVGEL